MKIKQWLQQEGHTQNWLADQLGVDKSTVSLWLKDPQRSRRWAVDIIRLSGGKVGMDDEWPPVPNKGRVIIHGKQEYKAAS